MTTTLETTLEALRLMLREFGGARFNVRRDYSKMTAVEEARKAIREAEASCPTCKATNRLTPADVARGYQCDSCANAEEGPVFPGCC